MGRRGSCARGDDNRNTELPFCWSGQNFDLRLAKFFDVEQDELKTVTYRVADGVAELCLNRPNIKNAANSIMWAEISSCLDHFADSTEQRVLVITGAGGAFCSGADLSDLNRQSDTPLDRVRKIGEIALKLHRLPKPTIAKVGGIAAGAGCNLALGCDLIYAGTSARFSEIFVRRGLSLDFGGAWLLPRLVGIHKAKQLALLGDVISASEAERIGIVNEVVPDQELDARVKAVADQLVEGPPIAISLIKAMLNSSFALTMEETVEREAQAQAINLTAEDSKEALRAFLEKRPPKFLGR